MRFDAKIITSTGVKWQTRFAVLTSSHLSFSKRYDLNDLVSGLSTVSGETIREAFDKYDKDGNRSPRCYVSALRCARVPFGTLCRL